ncbi:hypothetical protein JCM11641_006001 [Rhodosporidiobolus odoratus]
MRFDLDPLSYDLTLGGLAPFLDIWLPLARTREIAAELGRLDELAGLLEWDTRVAWSVEDKEEGGMVHNWKIPSTHIDPQEYSTALMLATPFPRPSLLPSTTQLRTLLPPTSSFPRAVREGTWLALWPKLLEWSVREWESHLEASEASTDDEVADSDSLNLPLLSPISSASRSSATLPSKGQAIFSDHLVCFYLYTTITSLLTLHSLLPSPSSSTQLTHLPPLTLSRSTFLNSSSTATLLASRSGRRCAGMYMCDAVARLVAKGLWDGLERETGVKRDTRRKERVREERELKDEKDWREQMEERVAGVEKVLRASMEPTSPTGVREEGDVGRLRRELRSLERFVDRLHRPGLPVSASALSVRPRQGSALPASSSLWEGRVGPLLLAAVFALGLAVGIGIGASAR